MMAKLIFLSPSVSSEVTTCLAPPMSLGFDQDEREALG